MPLAPDELRDLLGMDASVDAPEELFEIMDEGRESLDREKTAAVPTSKDFFNINDIVLFRRIPSESRSAIIGIVCDLKDGVSTQLGVRYWDNGRWMLLSGTTHYSNLTWIGSLERFGLTHEDVK